MKKLVPFLILAALFGLRFFQAERAFQNQRSVFPRPAKGFFRVFVASYFPRRFFGKNCITKRGDLLVKKFILFWALIALCLPSISFCAPIKIGAKGGLTISNIYGHSYGLFIGAPYYNFTFGIFGDIPMCDFLSFQPEINFIQKGVQDTQLFGQSFHFSYLEYPLLLKANIFSIDKNLRFNVLAGPYIGLFLGETFSSQPGGTPPAGNYYSLDIGYVLGGSIEFHDFVLDYRYENEMNSFYNGLFTPVDPITDVKNNLYTLSVGYKFLAL